MDVIAAADAAAGESTRSTTALTFSSLVTPLDLPFHKALVVFHDDALHGDDGHLVDGAGIVGEVFFLDAGFRYPPIRRAWPSQTTTSSQHRTEKAEDKKRQQKPLPKRSSAAWPALHERFALGLGIAAADLSRGGAHVSSSGKMGKGRRPYSSLLECSAIVA